MCWKDSNMMKPKNRRNTWWSTRGRTGWARRRRGIRSSRRSVASSGAGSLTAGAAVFACGEASRDRRFSRCKKNFYQWSWPDWLIQNMYKGEEKWWRNKWLKTSDLNLEFFQRTILGADYLGIMTQRKVSKIILFGGSSSWTILRFTPWTVWPPSQRSFWISPVS